jgi:SAM-dependent methyltransferase
MDPQIYQEHIEQENSHWWFCARRAVCDVLLKRLSLNTNASILEAGCGSGGNLPMLSQSGRVYGFEMDDGMRARASERNIATIEYGMLPNAIPFDDKSFDLIVLFDVLEHVQDDHAALAVLTARLNTDGRIFLTVPAFAFLFGRHDTLHHHHRRYSRADLIRVIESAGLHIEFINYWNVLLFPVAVIVRIASSLGLIAHQPGAKTPSPAMNNALTALVSCERFTTPRIPLPFGLSLIAVARKI